MCEVSKTFRIPGDYQVKPEKKVLQPLPREKNEDIYNSLLISPDILFKSFKNKKPSANTSLNIFNNSSPNNINVGVNINNNPGGKLINENSRVLHIGDSHTAGIYGKEMDKLLRATGAKVETVGSSSASPSWFISGHATTKGFYSKDEKGNVDSPADWKAPHATPKLKNLISEFQPNIILISLGANLLGSNGKNIESEVRKIAEIAKQSGAKIVWVGPPDGRESKKPEEKQSDLYLHLKKAASEYGTFVDSRPYTEYPDSGGDGVHYSGKEGSGMSKLAKSWVNHVYNEIQNSK